MKKTVNIIGSCVSRDCFNSKFVPEHSAYFTVNTYLPRIAVPALMTPGVTYDDEILAGEKGAWYYECYYKAYRKYFLSLLAGSQADFLLLDFYTDAYLGVREYDGQLITYMRNQRWTGSIDRSRLGRRFHSCRNVSAYRKLWRKYFDDFVQFLAAYCPDTCVVLNGIKGSDRILDSDVRQLPEVDLGAVNSFWQELDDYALQKYPEIVYLRYDREYRLDPAYPFGGLAMEFVHFERGYYEDFFAKLRTVSEERGKERQKNLSAVNLVRNGAFAQGLMGWFYRDSCWRVEKTEGHFWAVCGGADGQARDTWCWSDAIEVNGDSRIRYTLSFVCRAGRDVQEPDACQVKVREFKNARDREPGDALKEYRVNYLEQPYTFAPETKYVRIGLRTAVGEGGILFTDISLVRGEKAAAFQKCLDEIYFQSACEEGDGAGNSGRNLAGNGDFMECFAGWPYENARFLIRNIAGRNWAFVSEPWEENGRYLWKWSDAVEVREGLWYRLAVDYMVYDKDSVDFEDCAGIRCFRNRSDWKIRSAVGTFHIGRGEEVPEVNEVYHRIFCFQPGSRFIRIGIHLEKKRPHLYVTGFQLSEMSSEMRGGGKIIVFTECVPEAGGFAYGRKRELAAECDSRQRRNQKIKKRAFPGGHSQRPGCDGEGQAV